MRSARSAWIPVTGGAALLLLLVAMFALGLHDTPEAAPAPAPATTTAAPAPTAAGMATPGAAALLARPNTAGTWPGPNGLSGANGNPLFDTAHVTDFCTNRGRACRIAQTYTDRTSYESMTSGTGWTFENFTGFTGALVISQGLVPDGRPEDLAGCAAGDFDEQWRNFGNLMVLHERGDSVVRLGWEFNGDFSWRATDTTTWIACYRRAADAIRSADPAVILDWTINAHNTPAGVCGGVSTNCYPGDDYVDIIGIDNYDHFPSVTTEMAFDETAAEPEGLDWLLAFAKARGKPFAVGEWGVVHNSDGGGDSAAFVTWMHSWFAAHAVDLAYEAYFTDCGEGGVQSSLFRTAIGCVGNPRASDTYRHLFAG